MANYGNRRSKTFLSSIPDASINNSSDNLAERSKFNFSYFVNDDNAGQDFSDWSQDELIKFLNKLKEYSKFPLEHWKTQKVGKYPVFVNYGHFPKNSDFAAPKHIPLEAEWCRLHLENKPRVIGFVIPEEFHDEIQSSTTVRFDKNTLYIVFLDKKHKFYKTK